MKNERLIEFLVGLFFITAVLAFAILAMKVSGLSGLGSSHGYRVYADFTNIGGLKVRSPVTIAGVRVGEVESISLQPDSFSAKVTLLIDKSQTKIPLVDTSARILTEGLLGSNYISIIPGFDKTEESDKPQYLKDGAVIEKTEEAVILENLIGQLVFNMNK